MEIANRLVVPVVRIGNSIAGRQSVADERQRVVRIVDVGHRVDVDRGQDQLEDFLHNQSELDRQQDILTFSADGARDGVSIHDTVRLRRDRDGAVHVHVVCREGLRPTLHHADHDRRSGANLGRVTARGRHVSRRRDLLR